MKTDNKRPSGLDEMEREIRTVGLPLWLVLAAAFLLLAALLLWNSRAQIPTNLQLVGYAETSSILCYVTEEKSSEINPGDPVIIDESTHGVVSDVSLIPYSKTEIASRVNSDYLLAAMKLGDWNKRVTIQPDAPVPQGSVVKLSLQSQLLTPLDLVLKGGGV